MNLPLAPRDLAFLLESNGIEDITNIDYGDPANAKPGRGHVGAFLDSQEQARQRAPLTVAHVCRWQGWLTHEQVDFGHALPPGGSGALRSPEYAFDVRVASHVAPSFREVPDLMSRYLDDLNDSVGRLGRQPDDVDLAYALGEYFQRFEAIHPFIDGNGRTGRLIANYLATCFGAPIIVFRVAERAEFYRAHRSKMAMRVFMADKIREAVLWPGRGVLERLRPGSNADLYEGLIVERHALLRKVVEWRAADPPTPAHPVIP